MDAFLAKRERLVILLLCFLAAIRIFVYAAAFPLVNPLDECFHFDMVWKYANGHIPRGIEHVDKVMGYELGYYNGGEYLQSPDAMPNGPVVSPPWMMPRKAIQPYLLRIAAAYVNTPNTETTQPPVYYALAGIWLRLGAILGIKSGFLLYWIRFLNVPIFALTVWMAYVFARRLYPSIPYMRFAIPLLLTAFPLDVYYGASNDVLSPLLFGAGLYCLLVLHMEKRSVLFHAVAGLLVAAAFLTKFTNVGLVLVLGMLMIPRLVKRADPAKIAILALTAGLPIAAWLIRNKLVMGDFTGSMAKVAALGWTPKAFGQIWDHPIFRSNGLFVLWREFVTSLWRGELIWHGTRLAWKSMDFFYLWSSTLMILAAAIALFGRVKQTKRNDERLVTKTSLGLMAFYTLFLIAMSVAFDFGNCAYPSLKHPYFSAGRLVSGALIPFLALYVVGLNVILTKAKSRVSGLAVILAITVLTAVSEAVMTAPVFGSAFNFFHLF